MCNHCERFEAFLAGLKERPTDAKAIIVITGTKIKEASMFFRRGIPATLIEHEGKPHKLNAAAGVAAVLNRDYLVYLTGYNQAQLDSLAKALLPKPHFSREASLCKKDVCATVATQVRRLKEATGLDVHVVHYGGASDTCTPLPRDSVFSHTWDIPGESIPELVCNNCTTMLNIMQALHQEGIFATQEVSKLIFVSAITALRTKLWHGNDAAQKGAGHALIRSMALDLTPERIYVTELMPGITDTGFYDNPWTLEVLLKSSAAMGYDWKPEDVPVFTAEVIGDAAAYVLGARANIRELSVMPFGQYPQLGA